MDTFGWKTFFVITLVIFIWKIISGIFTSIALTGLMLIDQKQKNENVRTAHEVEVI